MTPRRVVCVIQARLGSTRFPRKVLADLCGKPVLQHVMERAAAIRGMDRLVLAVPVSELHEWSRLGVEVTGRFVFSYVGSAENVLARFAHAAEANDSAVVLRLTGDCPLIAPDVCERVLGYIETGAMIYATNDTRISGYPDGLDAEAFTASLLYSADRQATSAHDREHVTPWMQRHVDWSPIFAPIGERGPWPKLSVDTPEDLDHVRRIMARIPPGEYSWKATQEAIREEGL